jgi:hypothetical protein
VMIRTRKRISATTRIMVRSINFDCCLSLPHCISVKPLASSIHTIHRPIARTARSRRLIGAYPHENNTFASPISETNELASDSDNDEDFEDATPRLPPISSPSDVQKTPSPPSVRHSPDMRKSFSRAGSMATVRLQRRAHLAEKLREVFELDGIDEVVAGM